MGRSLICLLAMLAMLAVAALWAPPVSADPDQDMQACFNSCKGLATQEERLACGKDCIRQYKKQLYGDGGANLDEADKECLKACKAKYQGELDACKAKPSKIEKYLCLKSLAAAVQGCADRCGSR